MLSAYGLSVAELPVITDETGVPAGWLPLIGNYDQPLSEDTTDGVTLRELDSGEIAVLKERLRSLYVNGPDNSEEDDQDAGADGEEENEVPEVGGIQLPPDTFLEALSQKLKVNPISVYWLLEEMRREEGIACIPELRRLAEDKASVLILRLLGHEWPKGIERGIAAPEWVEHSGIISVYEPLLRSVTERLAETDDTGAVSPATEFEALTGVPLAAWLEREFSGRHIHRFRNRPIAWQIQTKPAGQSDGPAVSCLVYYHRIAGALPSLRTAHAGPLRRSFESELTTLGTLNSLSTDQGVRKERLDLWIAELREFQDTLEHLEARGFATAKLRAYAISDGVCSMTRRWLRQLRSQIRQGPLADWRDSATGDGFPPDLPSWIAAAVDRVDRQCAALAPEPPPPETPDNLLTPSTLAELFAGQAASLVRSGVAAICRDWQEQYGKAIIQPLKDEARAADLAIKNLPETVENVLRRKALKAEIKKLKKMIVDLTTRSKVLASQIQEWQCPEAELWSAWLGTQPLYDEIASLDGRRQAPGSIAEFVAQESQYQPDINDGVRVNIAPLQKAGVLARHVLAAKDVDKAIADRAEWRADERRWVRQGILPQPGWWPATQERLHEYEGGR